MADRLKVTAGRFAQAADASVLRRREALEALERLRRTLGYTETLTRGYAVVRAGDAVLTSKAAAEGHAALEIEFADGRIGVTPTVAAPRPVARPAKPKGPPGGQGSLF